MITMVVWDNIGNVLLGVRERGFSGDPWRHLLRDDDPAALPSAPLFDDLFADYEVTLHEVRTLDELDRVIADADFLVVHKEQVTPDVLAKGKKLRLIQHLGLDYRGVPMDTVRALGVPVCATPLVNYTAVAEQAWALILSHLKQLPQQRAHMQQRAYVERGWGAMLPNLHLVLDQTLGLLGFGEIARPMARYAHAFDMKTIYWDVRRFPELETRYNVEYVEWDDLFRRSDILSVQIPIKPETHEIITGREIGMMKPTGLFVNTARGKLVRQADLVEALRERRIGGAALDVFYEEPLPVDDPLHDLHDDLRYNVALTPHSAWQGAWTWVRDSLEIWLNVLRVLKDEPIHFRVDG